MHGQGTLTLKNGRAFAGEWVNSKLKEKALELQKEENDWLEKAEEEDERKKVVAKESDNLRQEEKLKAMRNNDETLVDWIYIMDGLSRIDEALLYLEE